MAAYKCLKCNSVEEKDRFRCPLCGAVQSMMYLEDIDLPKKKKTFQYATDLRMQRDRDGRPLPYMPPGMDGLGGFGSSFGRAPFDRFEGMGRSRDDHEEFGDDFGGEFERGERGDNDPEAEQLVELDDIKEVSLDRISTGFAELDETLGGGTVLGAAVCVYGNSGLGKSTILSQILGYLARQKGKHPVIYACGEEAPSQVKIRLIRLGILDTEEGSKVNKRIKLQPGTVMEDLMDSIEKVKPLAVVLDSISVYTSLDCGSSPAGGVRQAKYIAKAMTEHCQRYGYALFIVSHVEKSGKMAGPKSVQHQVDVVIQALEEQKDPKVVSFNCPEKNRFGKIDNKCLFAMDENTGLLVPYHGKLKPKPEPGNSRFRRGGMRVHE